jgi:hypothetical protein
MTDLHHLDLQNIKKQVDESPKGVPNQFKIFYNSENKIK